MMDESLWSEKTCCSLIPALPLWIIEYTWSNNMMEVLEVLGAPLWLEGDWGCLSLEDPHSIRVVAAEALMVIRARDIRHFERVMKFLDVTYTLLPQLVTSIKHMKIMFGLKTLVVMWMLWDDQSMDSITDKITNFFPDNLPQYHRSSRRHKEVMLKTQQDFRAFALSLTRNTDTRKTYIQDLMEVQYGECYAQKLEERLLHYLEELDKALQQPTCIDQVLKQSWQVGEREELLQRLLSSNSTTMSKTLKRLLRCAMTNYSSCGDAATCKPESQAEAERLVFRPFCITLRPSQEREEEMLSQASSQGSWLKSKTRLSFLQKGTGKISLNEELMRLKQTSDMRPEISQADTGLRCVVEEPGLAGQEREVVEPTKDHLCSRHGKKMKSILQECSEELKGQEKEAPLAHSTCTPSSPLTPFHQSTPEKLTHPSASPLEDSSSTNISLSSHHDSSSMHLSGAEAQQRLMNFSASPKNSSSTNISEPQQINLSQPSSGEPDIFSLTSPMQQNSYVTSTVQQLNISPLPCSPSLLQITPSQASSAHPSLSSQQESPSPVFSIQSHLLQISSAIPSKSPVNQSILVSPSRAHDISPSPEAPSVQQDSSSPAFSIQEINSPAYLGHQPCSHSSKSSSNTSNENSTHVSQATDQNLDIVSESRSVLEGKLKLSLATQGFFLHCKWMQPQVLLCRLSQQDCVMTSQPEGAKGQEEDMEEEEEEEEEKVEESFDVNLLYSDCESYTQDSDDSDDSDYVPLKRLKHS